MEKTGNWSIREINGIMADPKGLDQLVTVKLLDELFGDDNNFKNKKVAGIIVRDERNTKQKENI